MAEGPATGGPRIDWPETPEGPAGEAASTEAAELPSAGPSPSVSAGGPGPFGLGTVGMADGFRALLTEELLTDESLPSLSSPDEVVGSESSGFAAALQRVLIPVLPPLVVSALTSPLVVIEALVRAVASSGQALLLPAGFLVLGVLARLRRLLGHSRQSAPAAASGA